MITKYLVITLKQNFRTINRGVVKNSNHYNDLLNKISIQNKLSHVFYLLSVAVTNTLTVRNLENKE